MLSQYAPHTFPQTDTLPNSSKSVSTPACAINRMDPQSSYNSTTLSAFFRAVDAMANFPNTLGILAASVVVNDTASLPATPVIRAVVRDLKKYMQLQHRNSQQRVVPIGYESANTVWDRSILEYLCSGNRSSSIDFWTASFLYKDQCLYA
jgi:hypothetical protein